MSRALSAFQAQRMGVHQFQRVTPGLNDADRRLTLAGLSRSKVVLPGWSHANSSTLYDGTPEYQAQHWQNFHRNGMYYLRKWGGAPGQERFLTPFNGEAQ